MRGFWVLAIVLIGCGGAQPPGVELAADWPKGKIVEKFAEFPLSLRGLTELDGGDLAGDCEVVGRACKASGYRIGNHARIRISVEGYNPAHIDAEFATDRAIGSVTGSGFIQAPFALGRGPDLRWLDGWKSVSATMRPLDPPPYDDDDPSLLNLADLLRPHEAR